jgi:hypothetical protein
MIRVRFNPTVPALSSGAWRKPAVLMALGATLVGCISQVDREAMSFPNMPSQAAYRRADGVQLAPEQAIDALQAAQSACRNPAQNGGAPVVVGSLAFDRCMQTQGYQRTL